jgi:hypothetical protein
MKRSEVHVGRTYRANVSGKRVNVRITVDCGPNARTGKHGGWNAINETTNREIHIATAQRLLGPAVILKPLRCRECPSCLRVYESREEYRTLIAVGAFTMDEAKPLHEEVVNANPCERPIPRDQATPASP